jgi:Halocarboxylic acid dehydrogenase DehI.
MWDAMRPLVETAEFERAADELRAAAVNAASKLPRLEAKRRSNPGPSQAYQIRAALDLYHYVNPKLLIFTVVVRFALEDEPPTATGYQAADSVLIERGVPLAMYPMEMEDEEPDDKRIANVFQDIKKTLSLEAINSDYRTLALWPEYLMAAWESLKPVTKTASYKEAAKEIGDNAVKLARTLPLAAPLSRKQIEETGEDADDFLKTTQRFEGVLSPLILNIGAMALDWASAEQLARSPFPARNRKSPASE